MLTNIKRVGAIALLAMVAALFSYHGAFAEGSSDLTDGSPGYRAFLEDSDVQTLGIPNETIVNVYVQMNEYVLLGSSVPNSRNTDADITWTSPGGTDNGSCNVIDGGEGHIETPAMETAGPLPTSGGYDPCVFQATETGIYEVKFYSRNNDAGSGDPGDIQGTALVSDAFPTDDDASVAAWDVTVRTNDTDAATTIEGRAYANYLALNTGGWPAPTFGEVFVLTIDGYLYRVDLNGLDPFRFVFFSNSKGLKDANTGGSLFSSVAYDAGGLPASVDLHSPANPDDIPNNDITHKIFFNPPASDLPTDSNSPSGSTWLLNTAITPPVPSDLRFEGAEANTPNQAGVGIGGDFIVTLPVDFAGSLTIRLDVNGNGISDAVDRSLFASVNALADTEIRVPWDGRDGQGNIVPAGQLPAAAVTARFNLAEVHFPFLDPEMNHNGLIIERMTDTSATAVANSTVYYDDSDASLDPTGNQAAPNPRSALNGVDAASGAHTFGLSGLTTDGYVNEDFRLAWGNNKAIDTWALVPGQPKALDNPIDVVRSELAITKNGSPDPVPTGGTLTWTIRVENDGPSNANGATVTDNFPTDDVTDISWTCEASTGASCSAGSGSTLNDTVNIPAGGFIQYTVTATVTAANGTTISNTATVTRPPDFGDLDQADNSSTSETTVGETGLDPVDLAIAISDDANNFTNIDGVRWRGTIANRAVIYTITIGNRDQTVTAEDVQILFDMPEAANLLPAQTDERCSDVVNGTITCDVDELEPRSLNAIQITVQHDFGEELENFDVRAGVIANGQEDPNPADNTAESYLLIGRQLLENNSFETDDGTGFPTGWTTRNRDQFDGIECGTIDLAGFLLNPLSGNCVYVMRGYPRERGDSLFFAYDFSTPGHITGRQGDILYFGFNVAFSVRADQPEQMGAGVIATYTDGTRDIEIYQVGDNSRTNRWVRNLSRSLRLEVAKTPSSYTYGFGFDYNSGAAAFDVSNLFVHREPTP